MHTHCNDTPPRVIYWTTQAETEWHNRRRASLAWDAGRPASRGDVERYAIATGAECVNSAVVARFFGETGE